MPGTEELIIEKLDAADREPLKKILQRVGVFNQKEIECAMELTNSCLSDNGSNDYIIHTAKKDRHLTGYICYGQTPLARAVFDMYWLVVDKAFQGQGIGRQLIEFMEEQLSAEARMIMIETSSRKPYERARNLYRAMGYELVSQVNDFYDYGDNKLIFSKKL